MIYLSLYYFKTDNSIAIFRSDKDHYDYLQRLRQLYVNRRGYIRHNVCLDNEDNPVVSLRKVVWEREQLVIPLGARVEYG